MSTSQAVRQDWIAFLQGRGIAGISASLLEAFSPLALAGAQLMIIGEPVLSAFVSGTRMNAITELLENEQEYRGFITALKEGGEA
jgi:hypothetical protein